MKHPTSKITRRGCLRLGWGLPFSASLIGCGMMNTKNQSSQLPKDKINAKAHWARREQWTGEEWVFGVVEISDRLMMVEHKNELGWAFPGGIVTPDKYGLRDKENMDLRHAATLYVHEQTMIPVIMDLANVLAYGYVIDPLNQKVKMVHWMNVFCISDIPPTCQADLTTVNQARWLALDDPELGGILKMRLDEMNEAGEGKTLLLHNHARP
ncbi:MAG: hypothetical protein ACP5I1_01570 [Candidatus Hinthialibacter sp.]